MSEQTDLDQAVYQFVGRLEARAKEGQEARADLARLKRAAGREIAHAGEALSLFYRLLPEAALGRETWERHFFLVATLFPLAAKRGKGNLGVSLRRLRETKRGSGEAGVDRRMEVMLDTESEELRFRLRQVIRQLAQAEIQVDWRALLRDLLRWDDPDRRVRRDWARAYYSGLSDDVISTRERSTSEEHDQEGEPEC